MRIRLVAAAAIALAAVVTTTAVALAGTISGRSPINCQADRLTGTAVTTTSTTYVPISTLSYSLTAIYPISITLSGDVKGGPMAFEIVDNWVGGPSAAAPGPAFVTPAGGAPSAFSFTWVAPNNAAALRGHTLTVVWKRTGSAAASLLGGAMVLTYTTNACPGAG